MYCRESDELMLFNNNEQSSLLYESDEKEVLKDVA
jgi:hypothetical protein